MQPETEPRALAAAPRIGIAYGGGGARGLAHVLVAEALDELGLKPAAVAGTSIGAIIGAGHASGLSGRAMREQGIAMFSERAKVLARVFNIRAPRLADLLPRRFALGQLDPARILDAFVGPLIPPSFDDLQLPLTVVAADYYGWEELRIRTGDLRLAVAASIALPVLFRPVLREGRVLIDGGAVNPLPIDALPDGLDLVIGVDVIAFPEPASGRTLPSAMETMFGATQLLMQTVTRLKLAGRQPDLMIRPPINNFRILDFLKAREIIAAAEPIKDEVKRKLDRLLAAQTAEPALPPPAAAEPAEPRRRRLPGLRRRPG